jgi:hypothetical protein
VWCLFCFKCSYQIRTTYDNFDPHEATPNGTEVAMENQVTRRPQAIDAPRDVIPSLFPTVWLRILQIVIFLLALRNRNVFTFIFTFLKLCIRSLLYLLPFTILLIRLQVIMDMFSFTNYFMNWYANGGATGFPLHVTICISASAVLLLHKCRRTPMSVPKPLRLSQVPLSTLVLGLESTLRRRAGNVPTGFLKS